MKDGWDGITSEGFGLIEGWDDVSSEGWDLIEGGGYAVQQDLNPISI